MALEDLLPRESERLERGLSLGSDSYTTVGPNVTAMRGLKITNPPPSLLPYLVYEYGLGELTPYVRNLYELIDEGIDWQRVRGTPAAIAIALDWLGYAAVIEEFSTGRRHWNFFQLGLDRERDREGDLPAIEGVATLSVPLRSVFWRGFHGYDIRALEYGSGRWGSKLWGAYSGVRLPLGSAKWSFGRRYDIDHVMTEAELTALGVWLEPMGERLTWGAFPWPIVPWADASVIGRSVVMVEALLGLLGGKPAWAVFRDAGGDVIGYRRARVRRTVALASSGIYRVGGTSLVLKPETATMIYVEAMTGFGDGFGSEAESVGFILGSEVAPSYPPGALWLPPDGLVDSGPIVAETPITIEFGRTVRERVCALLRF